MWHRGSLPTAARAEAPGPAGGSSTGRAGAAPRGSGLGTLRSEDVAAARGGIRRAGSTPLRVALDPASCDLQGHAGRGQPQVAGAGGGALRARLRSLSWISRALHQPDAAGAASTLAGVPEPTAEPAARDRLRPRRISVGPSGGNPLPDSSPLGKRKAPALLLPASSPRRRMSLGGGPLRASAESPFRSSGSSRTPHVDSEYSLCEPEGPPWAAALAAAAAGGAPQASIALAQPTLSPIGPTFSPGAEAPPAGGSPSRALEQSKRGPLVPSSSERPRRPPLRSRLSISSLTNIAAAPGCSPARQLMLLHPGGTDGRAAAVAAEDVESTVP